MAEPTAFNSEIRGFFMAQTISGKNDHHSGLLWSLSTRNSPPTLTFHDYYTVIKDTEYQPIHVLYDVA